MKVTVITGSPHKKGTSVLLADEFIRGAQEAGWVLAVGCGVRSDIEHTQFPQEAYQLGLSLE